MASGDDSTSDGLGREERIRTKSLGKAIQENKMSAAVESQSSPKKNQNPKIRSTPNVAQDLTLSKGKRALQDSRYGHDSMDQNKQSSASWPIGSFRDGPAIFPASNEEHSVALGPSFSSRKRLIQALEENDSETDAPDPAQSHLEGMAASVAPTEPNVGSVGAILGEASLEPHSRPLVFNDVGHAEPNVRPIVALYGVAPAQSNVAPFGEVLAQPNIAPNVAPPVPAQPNAALIVGPPDEALASPNAAAIVAPPVVGVLDVNRGLKRSRLKPLRICEIGSEGHFWPKLP